MVEEGPIETATQQTLHYTLANQQVQFHRIGEDGQVQVVRMIVSLDAWWLNINKRHLCQTTHLLMSCSLFSFQYGMFFLLDSFRELCMLSDPWELFNIAIYCTFCVFVYGQQTNPSCGTFTLILGHLCLLFLGDIILSLFY